ncbi:MAG: right-handed parallel beta-helix repeat-containing protein, partial [Thermoplasmatales archaeon]|nr:right-handed parallel beta-helix repeat-containing protein [Thermoplasmatales archaeon]
MERDVGLIGGIVALLFLVGAAHAAIWYVHPDSALNSIQSGLDSCANNDTVRVGPGTYVKNIVWPNTQGIHLISELGPEMTIIDGNSTNSVIRITTGVDSTTIINGFTIQNGGFVTSGGGISCYNNASPTITGNTITDNDATNGGGIFCGSGCSPIISDNAITNNAAGGHFGGGGGGIFCDSNSLAIILDNTITNNSAWSSWDGRGGGIFCRNYNGMINGNTVTGNYAFYCGGGIYCYESSPTIVGNTINNNTAYGTYNILGGGILCETNSSPIIKHCNISDNDGTGITCRYNSSPSIDSCSISWNTIHGVYCYGIDVNPELHWNNIVYNTYYGILNNATQLINAEDNWWGDVGGPYHPTANPTGQGNRVSDYVDFDPWLTDSVQWVGVEEQPIVKPVEDHTTFTTTIFSGPLQLP